MAWIGHVPPKKTLSENRDSLAEIQNPGLVNVQQKTMENHHV